MPEGHMQPCAMAALTRSYSKTPAKENELRFGPRTELRPLPLHGAASTTTAIRVSAAQIKRWRWDLTSWVLTA